MKTRLALIPAVGLAVALAIACGVRAADDPEDDPDERVLHGAVSFRNNCTICHAVELVQGQRLTGPQWEAEITKMVGWGAPVPEEERPNLLAYLLDQYGADRPPVAVDRRKIDADEASLAAKGEAIPDADPTRGGPLYATHCASCHGPNAGGGDLGPNLVEKAVLVRDGAYRDVVRGGRNRMPGFAAVLRPRDEGDILTWLRAIEGVSGSPR